MGGHIALDHFLEEQSEARRLGTLIYSRKKLELPLCDSPNFHGSMDFFGLTFTVVYSLEDKGDFHSTPPVHLIMELGEI